MRTPRSLTRLAFVVAALTTSGLLTGCVTTRGRCGGDSQAAAEAAAFLFVAALEIAIHVAHHCGCH